MDWRIKHNEIMYIVLLNKTSMHDYNDRYQHKHFS